MSQSPSNWVWLHAQVLLAVHEEQLAEHGGGSGIRDQGLFESVLHRPLHLASYGQPDASALAAACLKASASAAGSSRTTPRSITSTPRRCSKPHKV